MKNGVSVAVIGATGAVGKVLLSVLEQRKFPVRELRLFASARSEGKTVPYCGKSLPCQVLRPGCFEGVQIAFFDASDAVSAEWVPQAVSSGAWVVDNSATYRLQKDVPLVVPEINGELIRGATGRILAGPNCSTVQLVMALKPLHDRWGLKRVVASTFQSASGAGSLAMAELEEQTRSVQNGGKAVPQAFPHPIAFNSIPQIGKFGPDGYTSEERKIMMESRKILGLPALPITATAVRVSTFLSHAESVNVEFERRFEDGEIRKALEAFPGIVVQDDPSKSIYPMAVTGSGTDPVYVGRLRRDDSVASGLNFWVVSDNLRKGAALNAVQIGERVLASQFP